ncbi:MAG: dUTP diphosphatase [Proteobacteria bacterium]|nr:dUTP diphosphatase [Pseudomonadota bacterium]
MGGCNNRGAAPLSVWPPVEHRPHPQAQGLLRLRSRRPRQRGRGPPPPAPPSYSSGVRTPLHPPPHSVHSSVKPCYNPRMKIQRLTPAVALPAYAKPGDAALDLQAAIPSPITLAPHEMQHIPSGLAFEFPAGHFGLMVPRSSMAARGLALSNGAAFIDTGYRGEIGMRIRNISNTPQTIQPLERLCQVAIVPFTAVPIEEAESLEATARGTTGFGSSGTH